MHPPVMCWNETMLVTVQWLEDKGSTLMRDERPLPRSTTPASSYPLSKLVY